MSKVTGIIIVLIVIVGGVYASMKNNDVVVMEDKKESSATTTTSTTTMKDKMSDTAMMKGAYEAYSAEKVARAEKGDVVLFFHASWCPSCRGLGSDIETNMTSIPEGVSILKVDYDKEVELKKKYGVTYQHTLVQVDKDGNLIKRWSASPKLSSLLSEIQ